MTVGEHTISYDSPDANPQMSPFYARSGEYFVSLTFGYLVRLHRRALNLRAGDKYRHSYLPRIPVDLDRDAIGKQII